VGREGELAEAAKAAMPDSRRDAGSIRVRWSAAARARALDWRQFIHVPGHSRLANRMEGLGFSIHATARIAPRDDLQTELQRLGRALMTMARDARSADKMLRDEGLNALRRRLAHYRERAHRSDLDLRVADHAARQIAVLETLARTHRRFEEQARRLEPRIRAMRARVFDARLDAATLEDLLLEMQPLREAAEGLAETLHEAYGPAVTASAEAARLRTRAG
jgi:hypothetical protein